MSRGKKKTDPSTHKVKAGVSLSPDLMRDLDFLVTFTNSSRSAVLSAACRDYLHEVATRLRESSELVRNSPDEPFRFSPVVRSFFERIALEGNKVSGTVVYLPPDEKEVVK